MAQTQEVMGKSIPSTKLSARNTLDIGETAEPILDVAVAHMARLVVQIAVADNALDVFRISGKATDDAPAQLLFSAAADFTSPAGLMVDASGDLTIQGVGSGWFVMDVLGFDSIIIEAASGNAGGSGITVYAGAC